MEKTALSRWVRAWHGISKPRGAKVVHRHDLGLSDVIWALGSLCALSRKPFDADLLTRQLPPPTTTDTLITGARSLGFRIRERAQPANRLGSLNLPCLVLLRDEVTIDGSGPEDSASVMPPVRIALVAQANDQAVVFFPAGTNAPQTLPMTEFVTRYAGVAFLTASVTDAVKDPDAMMEGSRPFGFRWFIPELLKHKRVWRDVLIASLVIQLLALATPLFTQVVIDKVVVHRTQSTLLVIGVGLAIFMIFSSLLTWVRQYLVLHTGNRVDAVLGAAVFEHLLKLPPRYFEHRPTGVITTRLRGVESIREFIASAAVTLMLDLPFLLIFVAIMASYSSLLTSITLGLIGLVVVLTIVVAPIFRSRLDEQFLLGARNQAFTTEYVAGLETVKSVQMEPQLNARYSDYLAEYLRSGFAVRQIANTYNVFAGGVEQIMTVLILVIGAWQAMNSSDFTIGMLVAFQMFASRVSQPMLRLVGLWQQFQQANLSVIRLGDVMNAPAESYALIPSRTRQGRGRIEIEDLSFRYEESRPFLYQHFRLTVEPGKVIALMGPSGSGKSTLAKLLQGFYLPTHGSIKLDGTDIRYLAANELREHFGVVPQDTVLFSGTLYDNLLLANPHATFEHVVQACRQAEIHEVIEQLPRGYQTEIGERGAGLSGGQKQRIAIARALLKQPRILIFDEATSSLDAVTAEHFSDTVNQLRGKVTMLFITHALPKNLQVDEIVHIGERREAAKELQMAPPVSSSITGQQIIV